MNRPVAGSGGDAPNNPMDLIREKEAQRLFKLIYAENKQVVANAMQSSADRSWNEGYKDGLKWVMDELDIRIGELRDGASMNRPVTGSDGRTHVAGPMQTEPFEVVPQQQKDTPGHKPNGLWWEVDGDWRRWCMDEGYGHTEGHLFEVDLGRSRILRLTTVKQLDAFHAKWSVDLVPGYPHIRWDLVAEEWDGIEIAPYLWDRRLDGDASSWYYSWDCASGVVWNPVNVRLTYLEPYAPVFRDWTKP